MDLKLKSKSFLNIFTHPLMGISLVNWCRVLWMNRFRFHILFLPKILFITIQTILNFPFQLFEKIWFAKRISRQKVEAPVFIIGHHRSGTTRLHYLLSKDEQFGYCSVYDAIFPHVNLTWGKVIKPMAAAGMPKTRPQDNVSMSIDSPKEEEFAMANISSTSFMFGFYFPNSIKNNTEKSVLFSDDYNSKRWSTHFDQLLRKLTYAKKGKRLLLKSPANTGRIKEILQLYPDAKFIHIHRDPIEVYQSTCRLYEKILEMASLQQTTEQNLKEGILHAYEGMYNKFLEEKTLLKKDQLIEVSFKNLEEEPKKTLELVYTQLGLDGYELSKRAFDKELSDTKGYSKNVYSQLSESELQMIKNRWGEITSSLGYKL